ncbi:MAG: HAD family hydrolase [Candidatus Heimdallarchaeota archaeon]
MPTTWPHKNLDINDIRARALNWTILLDLDGTVGYSLIPQSSAEKNALQFIEEWLLQQDATLNDIYNLDRDQLLHHYRQTKKQIYNEFEVLPKRHDKRLRFQRLLRILSEIYEVEFPETFLDQVMTCYWETFEKEAKPFKDTHQSLKYLRKDFLIIILTNNCWDEALKKLQIFGLEVGTHFDLLVTAECIGFCKDAQDFFEQLQEHIHRTFKIDLDPERLIVVGDEFADIEFANKAGLLSVRIKQDLFAEKEPSSKSEEPNYTIKTISELIPIMKNHLRPH